MRRNLQNLAERGATDSMKNGSKGRGRGPLPAERVDPNHIDAYMSSSLTRVCVQPPVQCSRKRVAYWCSACKRIAEAIAKGHMVVFRSSEDPYIAEYNFGGPQQQKGGIRRCQPPHIPKVLPPLPLQSSQPARTGRFAPPITGDGGSEVGLSFPPEIERNYYRGVAGRWRRRQQGRDQDSGSSTKMPLSSPNQLTRRRSKTLCLIWGILVLVAVQRWSSSRSTSSSSNGTTSVLVLGASVSVGFGGGCPSACSGHGYCTGPSTETCACHQGWAGGDCSIRKYSYPYLKSCFFGCCRRAIRIQ